MKSNLKLSLTYEAESDLRDVLHYTIATWGHEQAITYKIKLDEGFRIIQENPYIGHERSDILKDYRVLTIEKHHIIYWPTDQLITVIRILHVNRDISRHVE